MKEIFKTLSQVDVSAKTKKKNGLTYLPWSSAWGIVKNIYPSARFEVVESFDLDSDSNAGNFTPYFASHLGIMVSTKVTIEGETQTMHLPVTNHKNQALKETQQVIKTKYGESIIPAATIFDINTAIMRCLVKNLSLFGLGLYIYEGEEIPQGYEEQQSTFPQKTKTTPDTAKIVLEEGSENWNNVTKYVIQRKGQNTDLKLILRQLRTKYDISKIVESKIKGVYDNA